MDQSESSSRPGTESRGLRRVRNSEPLAFRTRGHRSASSGDDCAAASDQETVSEVPVAAKENAIGPNCHEYNRIVARRQETYGFSGTTTVPTCRQARRNNRPKGRLSKRSSPCLVGFRPCPRGLERPPGHRLDPAHSRSSSRRRGIRTRGSWAVAAWCGCVMRYLSRLPSPFFPEESTHTRIKGTTTDRKLPENGSQNRAS
jgi:hypothetical protein